MQSNGTGRAKIDRPIRMAIVLLLVCVVGVILSDIADHVLEYVKRGRMSQALADIRNLELACTRMLTETEEKDFFAFFSNMEAVVRAYGTYEDAWDFVIPELLENGNRTALDLKPAIRVQLKASYMTVGKDPWGHSYHFFAGPLKSKYYGDMPLHEYFRSYRSPRGRTYLDRNGKEQAEYYYDKAAKEELDAQMRGNPRPDNLPGYPAPDDLPVYIWSLGRDGRSCQRVGVGREPESTNIGPRTHSGDDLSNWDYYGGWSELY